MPYVPPHLRNAGGGGKPPTPEKSGPDRDSRQDSWGSSRDRPPSSGGGGSYSRGESYRGGSDRMRHAGSSSSLNSDGGGEFKAPSGPVFVDWKPSARVLAMNEQQIKEARERLDVSVEQEGEEFEPTAPIESFDDMCLHPAIIVDIKAKKYEQPTPIQCQGVPVALTGKDILGCAETGSGKTASFAIPMIQHCLNQPTLRRGDGPIALVLAPTRELAQQIEAEVKDFSRSAAGVKSCIVVGGGGGASMQEQRMALRSGVQIVVATPGRFIDHLHSHNTNLDRVSFVVLDEADRMMDMGFLPQISEVMDNIPPKHQTLLFSATMPEEIEKLASAYLTKPVKVKVGQVSTPTANVLQQLVRTTDADKFADVVHLLMEEGQEAKGHGRPMPMTIVFVERKLRCDDVAAALYENTVEAVALHGGLDQRERESSLRAFSEGRVPVLVATDVASRGLDVKGVELVVNLDLPKTFEEYVHRIGRTGRAGRSGRSVSFYTDKDVYLVSQIKKALSDLESGNSFAFATGKAARAREKELAQKMKAQAKVSASGVVQTGTSAVKVDDKYKYMAAVSEAQPAGAADDAWDD